MIRVTRGVLILRAFLSFTIPAGSTFIGGAEAIKHAALEERSLLLSILLVTALIAGCSGLASWFDHSYGRATAAEEAALNFSEPAKPSPEETVVRALMEMGITEEMARGRVAKSLRAAAQFAGIDIEQEAP